MTHDSGPLAIGELIGAANFITSIVAGSMAVIAPFRVKKAPFLRDVFFFTTAIAFTLAIIWDGYIYLWECISLVLLYVTYVTVVVLGNWIVKQRKKRRWLEQKDREEFAHSITGNEVFKTPEEFENQDAYGYDSYVETDLLLPEGERGPDYTNQTIQPISLTPLLPYDHFESYSQNSFLPTNDIDQSKHHQHGSSTRPMTINRRPSLVRAIEYRDVVNSIKLSSNMRSPGRNRTMLSSWPNNDHSHRTRRAWTSIEGTSDLTHNSSTHLAPNTLSVPSTPLFLEIPRIPHRRSSSLSPPAQIFSSPLNMSPLNISPSHEAFQTPSPSAETNQHLLTDMSIHSSPMHSPIVTTVSSPILKPLQTPPSITIWKEIQSTLFPSLTGFFEKSFVAKLTALMALPMILVLKLTLPVVEVDDIPLQEEQKNNQLQNIDTPSIVVNDDHDLVIVDEPVNKCPTGWNRWLTVVQFFFAPLFVSTVLLSDESPIFILYAFIVGILLSMFCIFTTSDDEPPKFYSALSFMGFGVAIVWVYLLANEVVGLLQALGLIMGLSDAILGLTIFAMGSSLGDFVANITIAKTGRPMMAISACFGGPMLNILLGIGLSGTYVTAKTGIPYKIDVEPTLFVSSSSLLIALFSALVYLPRNEYLELELL
ncbi:12685_t:CDS:2 [Cetraspora pellucida]|uniref:12685_t:CDS:1 n=1 Tax=Cetraspora pellucida TaxID=1433469 RepID=A0ACA9K901_9GLOM|nr:12685_t:CDS:2 [Cetraspora pellucida]